jgi:hypothetical protein
MRGKVSVLQAARKNGVIYLGQFWPQENKISIWEIPDLPSTAYDPYPYLHIYV